jgi:hypothetical protein
LATSTQPAGQVPRAFIVELLARASRLEQRQAAVEQLAAGENKNRRNAWGPQKNAKFGMEIDLNIYHNFCIGNFDQRSTIFK